MQLRVEEISEEFIKKIATDARFKPLWVIAQKAVGTVYDINKQMLFDESKREQEPDIRQECADFRKELKAQGFGLENFSNSDLYSKFMHPVYTYHLLRGL